MNTKPQADSEQVLALLRNDDLAAVERMRQALQPNVLPDDAIDAFTGWCLQQAQAVIDPFRSDETLDPDRFDSVRTALFQAVWRSNPAQPGQGSDVAAWTAAWRSIWSDDIDTAESDSPDAVLPADAAWLAAWSAAWSAGKQAVARVGRSERPAAWSAAWTAAWTAAWDAQIAYLIDLLTA